MNFWSRLAKLINTLIVLGLNVLVVSPVRPPPELIVARVCGESIPLFAPIKGRVGVPRGDLIRSLEYRVSVWFEINIEHKNELVQVQVRAHADLPIRVPILARVVLPDGWTSHFPSVVELILNDWGAGYVFVARTNGLGIPNVRLVNHAGTNCSSRGSF